MAGMITWSEHHTDQMKLFFYGRKVGYCGRSADMPICFIRDDQSLLTADEKTEVIRWVLDKHEGRVRMTPQTEAFWPRHERADD